MQYLNFYSNREEICTAVNSQYIKNNRGVSLFKQIVTETALRVVYIYHTLSSSGLSEGLIRGATLSEMIALPFSSRLTG